MTRPAELLTYLFEGQPHRLAGELMQWMEASPRFTGFVETYRDKIRKKLRVTHEAESVLDVRAELEVAYGLLNDRRLAVVYEPYASEKRRGADFAVTYRANLVFNVEVARLRAEENSGEGSSRPPEERILRVLLNKLGQMQPGMANLLAIHTRETLARSIDLATLMHGVKLRVEGKDPGFYAATRYSGPADFYKDFARLSGIVMWAEGGALWFNKQARPGLDEKVLRLVSRLPEGVKVNDEPS